MSRDGQAHTAFATGYRADIDGLRAIAVVAVILFHAHFWPFSGGFVGVDVFFVISGFLITSIIKKEVDSNHFSLARFYERRIRRIFPALFFLLLGITPLALFVLLPVETARFGQTLTYTALFAANLYFWRTSGYFAPVAERNPLLHTWSLAVEEQFYIFFPIFLLLLLRLRSRTVAVAVLGAAMVVSLLLAEWQLDARPDAVFYLLPTRAWELLLGAALAIAGFRTPSKAASTAAAALGLSVIGATTVLYSRYMDFPGWAAAPPCLATALVLYAGQRSKGAISRALSYGPISFVGKISYSLYLWHLPLLVLARIHLGRQLRPLESLGLIAAAAAISALSWRFIETPFRRLGKIDLRWRVIGLGVAASAAFSLLGVALIASGGLAARFAPEVVTADAAQTMRDYPVSCIGPSSKDRACDGTPFEVLVWGDSHSRNYFPGIAQHAAAAGLRARLQWTGGCPPVLGAVPVTIPASNSTRPPPPYRDETCPAVNEEMLALLSGSKTITAVALAGAWDFWASGRDLASNEERYLSAAGSHKYSVEESRRVLRAGLERTVASLRSRGLQVLLLGQVPDNIVLPPLCLALAYRDRTGIEHCGRPRADVLARAAWSRGLLRDLAAAHGAAVFDPIVQLCAGVTCLVEIDGKPLYSDHDHLTPYGSSVLGDALPPAFFLAQATGSM